MEGDRLYTGGAIALFPFLYDIILVIITTAVLSTAVCLHLMKRRSVTLHVIGLYLFYLVDTVIIFLSECIPSFATWYDRGFIYNPALKTVIFLGCALFTLCIFNDLFLRPFSKVQVMNLILMGVYLMVFPLLGLDSTNTWFYFTTYQVFTLGWSLYGLKLTKKMESGRRTKMIRFLMILTIVFSIVIAIEDGVVIFNFDSYVRGDVSIYIRNVSEDILRMLYSVVFFGVYLKEICAKEICQEENLTQVETESTREQPEPEAEEPAAIEQIPDAVEEFKAMKFAQELFLTGRELEVFQEMVAGKSNQQISEELCISMGTVKAHVHNIFQKAGVTHRYELMRKFDAYSIL